MAKIKVLSIENKREATTRMGTPLTVYEVLAQDENGNTFSTNTYSKEVETKVGQFWEGDVTTTPYGRVFKPARTAFRAARVSSPEERASIERQVSLKAAVDLAEAKLESGEDITSRDVLRVADTFVDWLSDGKTPEKDPEAKAKPRTAPKKK